jgi:hypothetical protein
MKNSERLIKRVINLRVVYTIAFFAWKLYIPLPVRAGIPSSHELNIGKRCICTGGSYNFC